MSKRLHYIDWLRVLAFMTLILFHCAVPFVEHYTWEINNDETSPWITRIIWWTHQWRLPLLFFIAGVGVRFSLKRRSVLKFFGERTLRLFIPLVFAIFFITPFQVYFEWLQKGRISSTFLEFYPQVYEIVPYPDGAFTWSHMWFVAYLFV
ncbi:MAG: acyltransferase family protein, partial [Bacteroidota bacterium]